jgi:uncharacterized membrane protein YcaP (DUF421 family)
MFFDNWDSLGRTVLSGILAYAALVLFLRVSGKRTLAKMNAFDLVVTVALGSCLATILLSHQVALVDGLAAVALLILLQWAVAWGSSRWKWIDRVVKSEPRLLVSDGHLLVAAMRTERVSEDEVMAAIRASGTAGLAAVQAVVLETDGSFSVIGRAD